MQKNVRGYKTEVKEFVAQVLFALGLVKAYEWGYVCGVPHKLTLTWVWRKMSVPTIERAGPTEYQEFDIVQGLRRKSFVMVTAVLVSIAVGLACLAYWAVLP